MTRYIRAAGKTLGTMVMLTSSLTVLAQQQQQQQQEQRNTAIDSIDVIRDYRPILADAVKIRRSPDMTNKREYQPTLRYSVLDKKLDITTGTKQLSIQEMPPIRPEARTDNYVKVGAGNYSSFLGEAYLTNTSFQDTRFGAFVKHLNQMGNLDHQFYSQQEVAAFGRQLYEEFTIGGTLGFKRYGTRQFGFIPGQSGGNLNPDLGAKQHYNDIYINAELASNSGEDNLEPLAYSIKMDGYLYSNAFETKENSLALSAFLAKQWSNVQFGTHLSGDFTQHSDNQFSLSNNIARIQPFVRFSGENYDIRLGANLVSEFGHDSSRFHVMPAAAVDFALLPGYFHVFGGVGGDVHKTSFRELSRENPWLGSFNDVRNTLERFNIYGGIKGNAGATFGYKVEVFYKQMDNMKFFSHMRTGPHLFELIYEDYGLNSSIFGLEGSMNIRISEMVSLGGTINLNEYDLKGETEAWYLPKMKLSANSRINISDRVYVDAELFYHGQTYANVPDYIEPILPILPHIPPVRTYSTESLPGFLDLSGGLNIKFTDRIGVFGRINNIFNANYQRYLYYPSLGMNIIGGVNFAF